MQIDGEAEQGLPEQGESHAADQGIEEKSETEFSPDRRRSLLDRESS